MARSENYAEEAEPYDCEDGHGVSRVQPRLSMLSGIRWESQLLAPCNSTCDHPEQQAGACESDSGSLPLRNASHDDDSGGVSGAILLQKGILTSCPVPSMNHVTKLTKRPSLSLSTNKLSNANNSPPSISTTSPSPTRKQHTLKRKDNLNVFRRSAPMPAIDEPLLPRTSQVTPRPQSQPILSSSRPSLTHKRNSSSTSIPITSFQAHVRSNSRPNMVRLGHPNRPYYSAIRKGMSSPDTTSVYTRPASPPSSFSFPHHARLSPSAQDSEDLVSESTFGNGSSGLGAGVGTIRKREERHQSAPSLSRKEEMELRLALARNVRSSTEDPDVGRQPGATDTLKRRMEKFRKGFKDIWRCRS